MRGAIHHTAVTADKAPCLTDQDMNLYLQAYRGCPTPSMDWRVEEEAGSGPGAGGRARSQWDVLVGE
jgi:hypothetical protein